jgi:hypothetical protein
VIFIFIFVGTQPASTALAASAGPLYPSMGANVSAGVGTVAWTNPLNINADDNENAQVVLSAGQISEYLRGTNFGFDIPTGATIEGITVTIGRSSSGNGSKPIRDHSLMLVKDGSLVGTDNADSGVKWPPNDHENLITYLPADPLWGTTWTAADINSPDFGVALSAINPDTSARTGYVDYINITVSYVTPFTLDVAPIDDYYGEYTDFTATFSPAVSGKTISFTLNGAPACSADTDDAGIATCQAPLLDDVGTYPGGVEAIFAGDEVYPELTSFADVNIRQKPASVTPDPATKIYGDADPAFSGTLTGFIILDEITANYSRTAGETVAGSPYIISATLIDPYNKLGNYNITYYTAEFTITPKIASVTPNSASKLFGQPDPALTGTLTGFLQADNVIATYSRTPGETIEGSPYTISAVLSPAGVLSNYTITYNTAYFYILNKAQTFLPLVLH